MHMRRELLLAALLTSCAGGANPPTSHASPEAAPELVAIPEAVAFENMLIGGQPTVEHLEEAKQHGYKTVVNLRTGSGVDEERRSVEALGMTFVHLPVPVPEGLTADNARKLARILDAHKAPFLIHCKTGDRAAALIALKAFHVDHKSAEEALSIGKSVGLRLLEDKVRTLLERCAHDGLCRMSSARGGARQEG